MTLKELPQVMAMSNEEKLQLIDDLLLSIYPLEDEPEVSDDEKRLLDERWENYLKNPDSALTMEQLKEAVTARLK